MTKRELDGIRDRAEAKGALAQIHRAAEYASDYAWEARERVKSRNLNAPDLDELDRIRKAAEDLAERLAKLLA